MATFAESVQQHFAVVPVGRAAVAARESAERGL
jgi:hypothetical protein